MSEYADRAIEAAEQGTTHEHRISIETKVAIAGVKAITYALLDLASAIREHAAR